MAAEPPQRRRRRPWRLLKTNLQKQDAVVEYLHDRGVAIDDALIRDHIVSEIIFMNRRLELDSAIEAMPEIITRRELDKYLGRQPRQRARRADVLHLARALPVDRIETCG